MSKPKKILLIIIITLIVIALAMMACYYFHIKKEELKAAKENEARNNSIYEIYYCDGISGSTTTYKGFVNNEYNLKVFKTTIGSTRRPSVTEEVNEYVLSDNNKNELKIILDNLNEPIEESDDSVSRMKFIITNRKTGQKYKIEFGTEEYDKMELIINNKLNYKLLEDIEERY